MNIFKSKSMDWWQVGLLKLSLFSIGIAVGIYWFDVLSRYAESFLILGLVLGVYSAFAWFRKK